MKHDKGMRYATYVLRNSGLKIREIMQITKKSYSFVIKWYKKADMKYKKLTRNRIVDDDTRTFMKNISLKTWTDEGGSLRSIAKTLFLEKGIRISHVSVRYHLKKLFKYLKTRPTKSFVSEPHKKCRIDFCRKLDEIKIDHKKIMFSDEKIFSIGNRPNRQTHRIRTNEKKSLEPAGKKLWDISILVCGAITYNGLSKLHMFVLPRGKRGRPTKLEAAAKALEQKKKVKGLNAKYYQDIVLPIYRDAFGNCLYFQQDGAKPHTDVGSIKRIFELFGVEPLKWPACSPDLNPIENLWSILQQRVDVKKPKTKDQLIKVVFEEWEKIDIGIVRNLINSFPKRLKSCLEKNGAPTKY